MKCKARYKELMPELIELARQCDAFRRPGQARTAGLYVGDVLTWYTLREQYVLLVIQQNEGWLDVKGFQAAAPVKETGSWRWPKAMLEERLSSGRLRRVTCVHPSAS